MSPPKHDTRGTKQLICNMLKNVEACIKRTKTVSIRTKLGQGKQGTKCPLVPGTGYRSGRYISSSFTHVLLRLVSFTPVSVSFFSPFLADCLRLN